MYTLGHGFTKPIMVTNPLLLVLGEAPGRQEMEQGTPFIGDSGHWLRRNILDNAGLQGGTRKAKYQDSNVLFDNTIRCLLGGKSGAYPTGKTRTEAEVQCRVYDLWEQFPKVPLLAVGAKAIKQIVGDERVGRWHGHIALDGERVVGCTYHPAAVVRNPNLLPLVVQEVKNLMRASRNPSLLDRPHIDKRPIQTLLNKDEVVFDLEWDDNHDITVIGYADNPDTGYSHYTNNGKAVLEMMQMMKWNRVIGGHNIINADLPALGYEPEEIRQMAHEGKIFDTQIASHIVHGHFAELGLLGLADMMKFYEPVGEWKLDKADLLEYNGRDAVYNYRLMKHLQRDLAFTKQEHLMPKQQKLAAMALGMHQRGIKLDVPELEGYATKRTDTRDAAKLGFPFNPQSHIQVKKFFAEYGIKLKDTQFETLKKLEGRNDVLDMLIDYKEDSKSLSTWFPLDKAGKLTADRIYPRYNVTGTKVVRPSCADPNVLNIPLGGVRIMEGGRKRMMPNLRRFLIPDHPDLELVSWDFSQIENRMLAYIFNDEQMLADFDSGLDIHRLVASRIFSLVYDREVRYDEVTDEERFRGKTAVHATNYCETPHHLATRLFGSRNREHVRLAQQFQDAYFRAYPAMRRGQDRISEQLDSGDIGLRNPFGRYSRIYAQNSHERKKRGVHNMGCGTAADFVNQKAIDIWEAEGLLPFQWVYDELCYALPKSTEPLRNRVEEILLTPVPEMPKFIIPVERKIGPNYGALSKVKK